MQNEKVFPNELHIFLNHIYELEKGIRCMALHTMEAANLDYAIKRLQKKNIAYTIQPVVEDRVNLYFGKCECIEAIKLLVDKPLTKLSPEEDFMLGAILGYSICQQCERFCTRKRKASA